MARIPLRSLLLVIALTLCLTGLLAGPLQGSPFTSSPPPSPIMQPALYLPMLLNRAALPAHQTFIPLLRR